MRHVCGFQCRASFYRLLWHAQFFLHTYSVCLHRLVFCHTLQTIKLCGFKLKFCSHTESHGFHVADTTQNPYLMEPLFWVPVDIDMKLSRPCLFLHSTTCLKHHWRYSYSLFVQQWCRGRLLADGCKACVCPCYAKVCCCAA